MLRNETVRHQPDENLRVRLGRWYQPHCRVCGRQIGAGRVFTANGVERCVTCFESHQARYGFPQTVNFSPFRQLDAQAG